MPTMSLKAARELAGLTQKRLAELAGDTISQATITDLETGRNRRPAHAIVVCVVRALQRGGLAGLTSDQIAEFQVPEAREAVNS